MKPNFRSVADIGKLGFRHRKAAKPDDTRIFTQEWYCENSACVVRCVDIHCKCDEAEDAPQSAKCPVCGCGLKFHGYVEWDEV